MKLITFLLMDSTRGNRALHTCMGEPKASCLLSTVGFDIFLISVSVRETKYLALFETALNPLFVPPPRGKNPNLISSSHLCSTIDSAPVFSFSFGINKMSRSCHNFITLFWLEMVC